MDTIRELIRRPHPVLVYFPLALYPLSFMLVMAYWMTDGLPYLSVSYWTFLLAVALIIPVSITGMVDMKRLSLVDPDAHEALNKHYVNGVAITLISIATGILFLWRAPFANPFLFSLYTIDLAVLSIMSMYQGYLGSTLVYEHHPGIQGETR